MAKILVIRFSSIGDIVLASPVFRCLKNQLPDSEIHFTTKSIFKDVTLSNPYIDKFHYFDGDLNELISRLKREQFDFVVDLHNNFRSLRIKRGLKVKSFTINKSNVRKFLLMELNINAGKIRHITDRSLDTVKPLGVINDGGGLDYFIPSAAVVSQTDIPTSHHAGYIAVVIGASFNCKKLPVYKLQELCKSIQHPIILIGGKGDVSEGVAIASVDPVKIYNACGKFSLNESADLVRRSKLVISHDTGFQYIACAFGKQVLAIWGCTSPRLGFEPYYGSANNSERSTPLYENIFLDLPCQPCSKGTNKCPLGHFNCMNKIAVNAITNNVHKRLGILQ